MPGPLRYTLLTDGRSDQVLMYPIEWLLRIHAPARTTDGNWADLAVLPVPPKGLPQRCICAVRLYPCELLLVHRDAENVPAEQRKAEIDQAVADSGLTGTPYICLVPVRMTEAWFLFDAEAIRFAAGKPRGSGDLGLPPLHRLEHVDAKPVLHSALRAASGKAGRGLGKFAAANAVHRLAESLVDYSLLRQLDSFRRFEADLRAALACLAVH